MCADRQTDTLIAELCIGIQSNVRITHWPHPLFITTKLQMGRTFIPLREYNHLFCEKFHQVDMKNYINYSKITKTTYCLSTFRLQAGSLHQDLLPVPVVSM